MIELTSEQLSECIEKLRKLGYKVNESREIAKNCKYTLVSIDQEFIKADCKKREDSE